MMATNLTGSSGENSWNLFNRIKSDPIVLVGPTMLMIYIIDSNLNFPHGRAISQTTINILFALIILQSYSYEK